MKFSQLEWEILSDVSEDTYGFEELLVTARSLHPTAGEQALLAMARDAAEKLLREEHIYVCWFQHTTNSERIVDFEEAMRLLQSDKAWGDFDPLSGRPYPAVHATESGKRTWYAGPTN